jgi:hypothetical protein
MDLALCGGMELEAATVKKVVVGGMELEAATGGLKDM